jgi:hypothetical protein
MWPRMTSGTLSQYVQCEQCLSRLAPAYHLIAAESFEHAVVEIGKPDEAARNMKPNVKRLGGVACLVPACIELAARGLVRRE